MKLYLKKVWQQTKDAVSGSTENNVTLHMLPEQLRNGMVKELGTRDFAVLLVLAAYLSDDNKSYPTLEQLGQATGLSRTTLITSVKSLEKNKIISVEKVQAKKNGKKSVYSIINNLADTESTERTAKDYLNLYCEIFKETYGHAYVPNYARECSMIKNKLMAAFSPAELPEIIEVAVKDYNKWSSNPSYPEPTVGALCTWLANKAAAQIAEHKKQADAVAKRIAGASKQAQQYNPLDLLEGGAAL